MSDIKLGQIIEGEANRDAIHMAIAPVVAAHTIYPGEHIGFMGEGFVGHAHTAIGIADPFLKGPVNKGDKFYMLLYQNTVTGMRHEWQHPAFMAEPKNSAHEYWLRDFCERWYISFDILVREAVSGGEVCFGTTNELDDDERAKLWRHLEAYTNQVFDETHRESTYFRCAC